MLSRPLGPTKGVRMARRWIAALWAALSLAPIVCYVSTGLGATTIAAAALVGLGWLLVALGARRDPRGEALRAFGASLPARVLGVCAAVLVIAVGVALSAAHALVALLAVGTVVLVLWSRASDGAAMARSAGSLLLLGGTLCFVAGAGEVLFRLPFVVARTGGNSPGTARWERENYDRSWEANRLHVRSLHVDEPKSKDTLRVLTIGDSFTWGDKIARTEDIWPYVLERDLVESGTPATVVNLAVGGYTTVNEAEVMRTTGWSLEPDVLIVQLYLNDTLPSGPGLKRESDSWYFRTWPLLPAVANRMLDAHSYFYSFLSSRFRSLQVGIRYPEGYAPLFADAFPGWQACKAALADIEREARARDVRMLVVLFPSFATPGLEDDTYPYAAIHRKVLETLDGLGVPALDLRPVYAKRGGPSRSWWALPCDTHPGVAAHRIAGEEVLKRMRDLGWVTRGSSPRPRSSS